MRLVYVVRRVLVMVRLRIFSYIDQSNYRAHDFCIADAMDRVSGFLFLFLGGLDPLGWMDVSVVGNHVHGVRCSSLERSAIGREGDGLSGHCGCHWAWMNHE